VAEPLQKITANKVRYVKLGKGGEWAEQCFEENSLRIGHSQIPHSLASTCDREAISAEFRQLGFSKSKASDLTRELLDFYDDDEDTIWITFADGFLWWCRAKSNVVDLGADNDTGTKMRWCANSWSNCSPGGNPLRVGELSGKLTRTAAYRQTICAVGAADYLIAKLNDEQLPEVIKAREARAALECAIGDLIKRMTWQDFELLVDLTFASSGWRRTGITGGVQETVDIELVLPSTGERAFVQVKSSTDQAEFRDYAERFSRRDEDRMFYVYHSASQSVESKDPKITVIGLERLSAMVVDSGLAGWVIDQAS